jgi:hypothetical protein
MAKRKISGLNLTPQQRIERWLDHQSQRVLERDRFYEDLNPEYSWRYLSRRDPERPVAPES